MLGRLDAAVRRANTVSVFSVVNGEAGRPTPLTKFTEGSG